MTDQGPLNYNGQYIQPDIRRFGDLKRNFTPPLKAQTNMMDEAYNHTMIVPNMKSSYGRSLLKNIQYLKT